MEFLWPDRTFSTMGALTYVDDAVRLARGRNVFADRAAKFFSPRDEEILSRDPEVVLVNVEPQLREITVSDYLEVRRALARTSASRSGRVHSIVESPEANPAHPGPSFVTKTMKRLVELVGRGRA